MSWPVVKLGEVCESIEYGVTASASELEIGPKFLRITDIQDGAVNWNTVPFCEADSRKLENARLRSGDIVFARTGATTGKSFLIENCPENAVFASYLIRVRPNSDVKPSFLAHFFDSPAYWEQITLKAAGAAQPGVNATKLKELEIPLPPLAEQKRIAAILDQAARLTRLRAEALARLDTLGQAIFHEMFGDEAEAFPQRPLSSILSAIISGVSPKCSDRPAARGETGILKLSAVTSGTYLPNENKFFERPEGLNPNHRVRVGDLLFTRKNTRDLVAAVAIAGETDANLYLPDLIYRLEIKPDAAVQVPYLHALLASKKKRAEIQLLAGGAAGSMPNISKAKLLEVCISIPPLELQNVFAKRLEQLRALQARAYQSANASQTLFASLQHRAFRGEL